VVVLPPREVGRLVRGQAAVEHGLLLLGESGARDLDGLVPLFEGVARGGVEVVVVLLRRKVLMLPNALVLSSIQLGRPTSQVASWRWP
jgi:hypothetical protein